MSGGSRSGVRRHELPDAEREFVRPLLPESLRGRKRLDDTRYEKTTEPYRTAVTLASLLTWAGM
ncbi:hypothetical protein ACIO8F_00860 [Streptomyces sp. NPDC087228]|uniref:hypothetical protein n=1 Tax=Streptomyces sp. NPDC087228 TaxID=3365772 RepID=UPI00380101CE